MYIYKNYYSTTYGEFTIDLDLPYNIQLLYLYNSRDSENMRLTTSSQNTGLTRIYCSYRVELESYNFFNNYTGLQSIYISYLESKTAPSFTNLHYLTYLSARITGPNSQTFDSTIVSGLSNLKFIDLVSSYFNGITKDAFRNLVMLTYLNLGSNKIRFIEDGVFTEMPNMLQLSLANNKIRSASRNVFVGLIALTYLSLSENRGFPTAAFLQTKSVEELHIQYNDYQTLDSIIFQQMNSLINLYVDNPLTCDCNLEWVSRVSQFGIGIYYGECFEPYNVFHEDITNPQLYVNCSQSESLQCFDKSNTCPINQICQNTEDSYFCDCPIGYELNAIIQCGDINECEEVTNCTQACENTDGSYYCVCDVGYELASNGYDCDDINECQEWNGGCEFGCRNTIGSYQCYCQNGHELHNETHCEEGVECELMGESCINLLESNYLCKGGFNLSISNYSCPNVNSQGNLQLNQTSPCIPIQTESQWIIPTAILMGISLVANVILIFVIIIIFIYFVRKDSKMLKLLKAEQTQGANFYRNDNNESFYNCVDELRNLDEVKETDTPEYGAMRNDNNNNPDLLAEDYPGNMQDENVRYQMS
ncbi:hypothetical protein LOD99_10228 [Oopsacas minuta]|uniref:EGF-like domain-containing protein n=1 Tax=Oopsacas minuta TaxID=111878 RepID=A0AAV7KIP5_9METZ|nr:hypothetical protein LOD99_10228 [Oopsacas minuta]